MTPLAPYRRVMPFLRPYLPQLALVGCLSLLGTSVGLLQPYFSKLLIDDALTVHDLGALGRIAAWMVCAALAASLLGAAASLRYTKTSAAILFDMRSALYAHLLRWSPRQFAGWRLGELVSRLNNDVGEVQRIAADTILAAISNVLFLAGSLIVMLLLDPVLSLASVALIPASVWALRRCQAELAQHTAAVRERSAGIGTFLIETLSLHRLVAASNRERAEGARFTRHNQLFLDALLLMQRANLKAGLFPGAILTIATAVVFTVGGARVIEGKLTIGALVAFMAYHLRLLAPVQSLMGLHTSLVTGAVSLRRVTDLFDTHPAVAEPAQSAALPPPQGEIRFEDVSFEQGRDQVLSHFSLHIPAGAICAVTGPTGAGKSTLADLLLRFEDPQAGRILLDGHDLRGLPFTYLRTAIATVEQTPLIFHASLRENIAYADPAASQSRIEAAARAAAIHDFIAALPQGYDTIAGDRGLALSAGERQRIAIARALLRDAPIVILDEPTSALDEQTELALRDQLAQALQGRTAILVTHRPALLGLATQRAVLGAAP
ncbi:MAG: ABC transporter ATP-binding protein [Acidobacteria bacterium]|nr:ABC transporter ATP-binding protein [Acidobacteriota bacterium]